MNRFLGVDGGGSKTGFVLIDADGSTLAETVGPSCYYFTQGIGLVDDVLADGIAEICRQAGITPAEISHAFFGLPSYGEVSGDVARLDAAPAAALGHDRYACDNDMVCGWAGSLGAVDGINVISGTGSMTYGEYRGRGLRVGGWGEIFGDEGSAYWIAIQGLNAFSRMSDGRAEVGPLVDLMRTRLDVDDDLDVVDVVLNRWQSDRGKIADLAKTVAAAADADDRTAEDILARAAHELADLVDATRSQLGFEGPVPVSYSGGVFASDSIRSMFERDLGSRFGEYELRRPLFGPIMGAALYAAKLHGAPITTQTHSA